MIFKILKINNNNKDKLINTNKIMKRNNKKKILKTNNPNNKIIYKIMKRS